MRLFLVLFLVVQLASLVEPIDECPTNFPTACSGNLKNLSSQGVKYVYGILHTCQTFLFSVDKHPAEWGKVYESALGLLSSDGPRCDTAGMSLAFDFKQERIVALRIVHRGSGVHHEVSLGALPLFRMAELDSEGFPDGVELFTTDSAQVLTENVVGIVCQVTRELDTSNQSVQTQADVLVGAMIHQSSSVVSECLFKLATNETPMAIGFVMSGGLLDRALEDVLHRPGFWKNTGRFLKMIHLNYWHISWVVSAVLVLLVGPMLMGCGRVYRQMLVSAARFNVALDALIATNCDNLEHILERQKLLSDSGYDTISLRDITVNENQLRSKAARIRSLQGGKPSGPKVNQPTAPSTPTTGQVAQLTVGQPPLNAKTTS